MPRKKNEQDTSDLAMLAINSLQKKYPKLHLDHINALVVVTQNPDGEGLPQTAAILQNKIGMPKTVASFDVSLGCSGYVYGLFILKGFLEASGLSNGILVTCDPYSKVINQQDRITSMLFGDAATATLLGENPVWSLDSVIYETDGAGAEFLKTSQGKLYMNGRQIFNFASGRVAQHISQILDREGYSDIEIDLFCLHQGSNAIIDAISKQFKNVSNRFVKDMANTGNTVSSSIPLILENRIFDSKFNRILISGFGVGLSMATAIISKQINGDKAC